MENLWANFAEAYRAKSVVWLEEFRTFKDKSSAINLDTGVNSGLADMIIKWHGCALKLAVGKPEYKLIIETRMGIPCLYDEAVMEVMWGLKNIMHSLLPQEKSELTKEDRLQMSQGLKMLLDRYGFDVKPEMVNERIVGTASVLFDCDFSEKKLSTPLRRAGVHLKDVSGINSQHWDLMKLATALQMICYPQETIVADDPQEMLTADELSKLVRDAHKYEDRISKGICLKVYEEMVLARELRTVNQIKLASLVREAKEAYETERSASEARSDKRFRRNIIFC